MFMTSHYHVTPFLNWTSRVMSLPFFLIKQKNKTKTKNKPSCETWSAKLYWFFINLVSPINIHQLLNTWWRSNQFFYGVLSNTATGVTLTVTLLRLIFVFFIFLLFYYTYSKVKYSLMFYRNAVIIFQPKVFYCH